VETILQRLTDLDEVIGAVLVGKDGLIVAGALHSDEEEVLGAMSAAVIGSINNYTRQINSGEMRHVIIETQTGMVQLAEVGDLILVVTSRTTGNLGRIRLEMQKTCRQLSQLVASF
jgi:predicted regulator of Ras-like GTPase activity (Roadblock/LC7/MglB family)